MKLDRFLAKRTGAGRTAALRFIAARRARVNGEIIADGHCEVDRFCRVELDNEVLQHAERALYLMLHKPACYVSATIDAEHPTVIDLIDDSDKSTLHIAGRLDRSTTGLVLLTNDGRWSKQLMDAAHKVAKTYLVETSEVIAEEAIAAFAAGFHFHTEDIITLPAHLQILGERQARLTLHEGRYHQVKRMFHRIGNRVTALHRERIGHLALPPDLPPGSWRPLTEKEIADALRP